MSVTFVEKRLPPLGTQYVEQQLRDGNSLSRKVLEKISLQQGEVTTCLPRDVVPKSLQDFRTGGKLPTPPPSQWRTAARKDDLLLMVPIPTTDDWLVAKIKHFLLSAQHHVCVFEDSLKQVGDAVLDNLTTTYATFNNEIYHVLFSTDADEQTIKKVLKSAKSIPTFIGTLTEWQGPRPNRSPIRLSATRLELLAMKTHNLIVGAFDGESYLIWHNDSRNQT